MTIQQIKKELKKFVDYQEMVNVRNLSKGKILEINLGVKLKNKKSSEDLTQALLKQKGIMQVNVVSIKQSSEF